MQPAPERMRIARVVALAFLAVGYALTLAVFYPGIMTYDAKFIYGDIAKHFYGDWQSPVMTLLWAWIDPIAPGSASMFLLIATVYWLAFTLLTLRIARESVPLAVVVPLLALLPPAFVFVGIIWRDVLFAATWLLAAVLVFVTADNNRFRIPAQTVALALCSLGVLLRPNAIFAAAILAAYIVWPARLVWKRVAILFVPAAVVFFLLVQLVYYGALGATRQSPLQSVMIFDLGGISHFAKENQFPVAWNEQEQAAVLNGCYRPTEWDIYWRLAPCEFVMERIEGKEKLFGTSAIPQAWLKAITHRPAAYLEHRAAFMWNFLIGNNLTIWVADVEDPTRSVFPGRAVFAALKSIHDALKPTPLFRAGTWLVLCIAICVAGWRRRETPAGAFAIGICACASVYVLTFFAAGVASDFRYGYLAVLAALAGGVAVLTPRQPA